MTDTITNELLLERLDRLHSGLSEIEADLRDIKSCLGSSAKGHTSLSHRVDWLLQRLERLERRSWWERPLDN